MEKLFKTTEDERKVFHSILCHNDSGVEKKYTLEQILKMLDGLEFGLDFDKKKVMIFCEKIRASPVCHNDVHVRNIMKDSQGNFKLIDFDRSTLEKK